MAATHNNFLESIEIRNKFDGWPSRWGEEGATGDKIPNLILVSGIDKNTNVALDNPYREYLALAPSHRINVADSGSGYIIETSASLGISPVPMTLPRMTSRLWSPL